MYPFRQFTETDVSGNPHYLVVGHPISHSLSPLMHNAALEHNNISARYFAVDLGQKDFSTFISWLNRDSFLGCNVTIPHKQQMMDVVDELDESVLSVGALNTIVKKDGYTVGYNTDIAGFLHPLNQFKAQLEGSRVIVFGTGGAGRAVVYALAVFGVSQLIIVTRDPANRSFAGEVPGIDEGVIYCGYENWTAYSNEASMVVNTTPLGMKPNRGKSPVRDREAECLAGKICYDLVYNPLETNFLKQCNAVGGIAVEGLQMLLHQGNESFKLWTGRSFPLQKVETMLREELESSAES